MVETKTKERPIVMSTESVQAIRSGSKTQTRRVVKTQPEPSETEADVWLRRVGRGGARTEYAMNVRQIETVDSSGGGIAVKTVEEIKVPVADWLLESCPYEVGMRLWVKEAWRAGAEWDNTRPREIDPLCGGCDILYSTDTDSSGYGKKRSPWYMPRWASRLTLEVTDVRCERLQEISEDDAVAEGIERTGGGRYWLSCDKHPVKGTHKVRGLASQAFRDLWDSINAKRGYSWDSNCWVWVISFRKVEVTR